MQFSRSLALCSTSPRHELLAKSAAEINLILQSSDSSVIWLRAEESCGTDDQSDCQFGPVAIHLHDESGISWPICDSQRRIFCSAKSGESKKTEKEKLWGREFNYEDNLGSEISAFRDRRDSVCDLTGS